MLNIENLKQKKSLKELLEFGIINIDKPSRPTSFDVSEFVMKKLGLRKTSHFGTLDPKVTGVLPIALNRACKLTGYFLGEDKEYVGIMRLHEDVDLDKIRKVIKDKFTGKITQIPPVKSRVKRQEREKRIDKFELLEKQNKDILFKVECEGGTYIRKLCLHPEIEVITDKGLAKIKDLYLKPKKIYSLDENQVKPVAPSAFQKIVSPKKLIKLRMCSGVEITATPDHEILISTKEGYKMKSFHKLKKGDYLVKSSSLPVPTKEYVVADLLDNNYYIDQPKIKEECKKAMIKKFGSIRKMNKKTKLDRKVFLKRSKYSISIKHLKLAGIYEKVKNKINKFKTSKGIIIQINKLTPAHFYLLGLIASDGNNTREKKTKRFTRLKFHNKERELIKQFKKIYSKLFPSINISEKKIRENLIELDSSNSLFATIAANLGIVSPEKNAELLPILYCKDACIKSFLKGYFDGDGNVYFSRKKNKKGYSSSIKIYCVYYHIIKRIHQMLLKLGIYNDIKKTKTNLSEMYFVNIKYLKSKKKFSSEIGSNHPLKKKYLKQILIHERKDYQGESQNVPLHYKKYLDKNKNKLKRLGGNLYRILKSNIPVTKRTYEKASKIVRLPKCDNLIIERVEEIEKVKKSSYVYDMTIPNTHNFLIETGYVSSNCDDLGKELGVGAHMLELRRIRAGIFKEEDSIDLYEFEKLVDEYFNEQKKDGKFNLADEFNDKKISRANGVERAKRDLNWKENIERNHDLKEIIIPAEIISQIYPVVEIKKEAVARVLHGSPIYNKDLVKKQKIEKNKSVCVFSEDKFIGMHKTIDDKNIFAKPEFVLQDMD